MSQMMAMEHRWLNRDQAAEYVGKNKRHLARLIKLGKLPAPSYHFGPKSPRWDRHALDALFSKGVGSSGIQDAVRKIADGIAAGSGKGRQTASR